MVGLGETYIPAFALAAGLGEVAAGLIATLPMLAGAVFQLVTPFAVRQLHSYRRWVVVCAALQGLALAPLAIGALRGQIALAWVAFATVAYWSFGMATGPAWNAWVTTLVPPEIRKRFFARRARLCHAALFAAMLVGGLRSSGATRTAASSRCSRRCSRARCSRASSRRLSRAPERAGRARRRSTARAAAHGDPSRRSAARGRGACSPICSRCRPP